jgi:hypothetical protein
VEVGVEVEVEVEAEELFVEGLIRAIHQRKHTHTGRKSFGVAGVKG